MSKNANSTGTTKISTFVLAAIYITLILSVVAIIVAIGAFYRQATLEVTIYLLAIGFIAMALSGYYLFQSRKHVATLKIENPQILTAIDCKACNGSPNPRIQTRRLRLQRNGEMPQMRSHGHDSCHIPRSQRKRKASQRLSQDFATILFYQHRVLGLSHGFSCHLNENRVPHDSLLSRKAP